MNMHPFKRYDIRGKVPEEIDEEFVALFACAVAHVFRPERIVTGHDIRISSEPFQDILCRVWSEHGIRCTTIGLCGTEEIYYAVQTGDHDLGIMITASHNPADENGFKCIHRGGIPVTEEELQQIRAYMAQTAQERSPGESGAVRSSCPLTGGDPDSPEESVQRVSARKAYIEWLLDYTRARDAVPVKIVADAGNGCAGVFIRELAEELPHTFVFTRSEPDGRFPYGVPNPLLPEQREHTAACVRESGADLGLAWDGDFDRCFMYTRSGRFVEGAYVVGFLACALLQQHPGARIVHDPRVYWNTQDLVQQAHGTAVMSRTGHALMKASMRRENAVYGGEMSAHHYFREFAFCDSGMLPWLLLISALQRLGQDLDEALAERVRRFPMSGEISLRHSSPETVLDRVQKAFSGRALHEDHLDGLNMEFREWRFNLRSSNTEPVMRLNVEGRSDAGLVEEKTRMLLEMIRTTV